MQDNQFNYLRLLRPLTGINDKMYDVKDFAEFRPSYEYLVSRETKTCQHCRSLIYNQTSDVSNLSMLDILETKYFPKYQKSKSALEVLEEISIAYNSLFSDTFKKMRPKSNKEFFEASRSSLTKNLNITDSILQSPIFHRCNKCFKVWNIHLEMKQRFLPPSRFLFLSQSISQTSVAAFDLPKIDKYYQGIIFLSEKSEDKQISNHILEVKKLFVGDNGALLYLSKKNIAAGDLSGAINNLCSFTNSDGNKFYYNAALQIQSRHSLYVQEKLKGLLSHQEETILYNNISNSAIMLIDEILKYKNM